MTSCAIMQPTYLPWAGYFNLIASADVFVLLDDVQYERNSWQSKNRILKNGRAESIAVPVRKQPLQELIANIEVDDTKPWRERHATALRESYGHIASAEHILDEIERVLAAGQEKLAAVNTDFIRLFASMMGLPTPIVMASELGCSGRRSEHVAEICRVVGADSYLSPAGAREYLTEDNFEVAYGIPITYMEFSSSPYSQGVGPFVSHLSVVDLIAHCGAEFAAAYVGKNQ